MTYRNIPEQPAPMGTAVATIARSAEFGEYRVRLSIGGAAQPNATYYTDDIIDARRTADAMMRRPPTMN